MMQNFREEVIVERQSVKASKLWENNIDKSSIILHSSSIIPADLDTSFWIRANNVVCSSSGSAGVFIVSCNENQISQKLVVKACSTVGQEAFANLIARKLNIPVPRVRIIGYHQNSDEWVQLKSTITDLTANDIPANMRARKELDRAFVLVMEFVEGNEFLNCLPHSFSSQSFFEIGLLCSFDMLINNWDRLPLIWDNDGNFGNIMFQQIDNKQLIVGIDQCITVINPDSNIEAQRKGFARYFNRVQSFLTEIVHQKNLQVNNQVRKLIELLQMITGQPENLEQSCLHLQRGIIEGINRITKLTEQEIELIATTLRNCQAVDWSDCWKDMNDTIKLPFIFKILELFKQAQLKIDNDQK
eukprot:TRINITY_DN839_c1_g2_i1.p1 TRINITY_DN839_c1_g2~~TRINITY_DN839_c1_g2_i1.p1  ORF type:complete len:358 (-),score=140.88 TRINITY_DN839_c1_g2_i1:20-1093(-)